MFSFFIFKNKEKFVFVLFFILSLLFMSFSSTKFSISLKTVFNTVVYPFEYVFINIREGVTGLLISFSNINTLKNSIKEKEKLIEYYKKQLSDYYSIKYKLKEMEELLKYKSDSTYKLEVSKIINREEGDIFSTITIDKGYIDGIKIGMPVIGYNKDEPGIIGVISEVYLLTSKVKTYKDPLFSVGVYLPESKIIGVVNGMGKDKNFIELNYIDKETKISLNEVVLTTSESSIFPENIKVGYIKYIDNTDKAALTYKVFIKPYVDLKSIKNVFIITEKRE